MKPQLVIFSSSAAYPIAEGITAHLKDEFTVHPWKGEFFGENKTTPLWTFFKKLFHYDYAVLVLSADRVVPDEQSTDKLVYTLKDNVLFELGASMARLGPQKTILVVPDQPEVRLPGYFDDVKPNMFVYQNQEILTADDQLKVTATAANNIRTLIKNAGLKNFHSELPAQGLAHAYLANFFNPVTQAEAAQQLTIANKTLNWSPEAGMTFTIVIPDQIMGRNKANDFFEARNGLHKTSFRIKDGRDLGIYVLPRKDENSPLHILDIPTTLLTAENIIDRIEHFWRETDREKVLEVDRTFTEALKQREIVNFRRTLDQELAKTKGDTYIVSSGDLSAHLEKITKK